MLWTSTLPGPTYTTHLLPATAAPFRGTGQGAVGHASRAAGGDRARGSLPAGRVRACIAPPPSAGQTVTLLVAARSGQQSSLGLSACFGWSGTTSRTRPSRNPGDRL